MDYNTQKPKKIAFLRLKPTILIKCRFYYKCSKIKNADYYTYRKCSLICHLTAIIIRFVF